MKIRFATIDDKRRWNNFVERQKGSVFHLFEWREILMKCFGYKPFYLLAECGERVCGILPTVRSGIWKKVRFTSVPLADYAGPLGENEEIEMALIETMKKFAVNKGKFVINTSNLYSVKEFGLNLTEPYRHFVLKIPGNSNDLLQRVIPQKTRNMIYKAERNGLIVKEARSSKDLWRYYKLYVDTMKRLLGLPMPYKIYESLWEILGQKMKLFLVYKDQYLAAGLLSLIFGQTMYIWGNASAREYGGLGANNLAYFGGLKYAVENGLKLVDFGSTMPNTSHYFFKSRWGASEKPLFVISSDENFGYSSKMQKRVMQILKFAPTPFLSRIAGVIYTYL